ncbi:hypothetical protein DV737_g3703, partial [Chaetothyriales sp. CBS 132003]
MQSLAHALRLPATSSSRLLLRPVRRQTVLSHQVLGRWLSSEVRTAIDRAVASAPVVLFMKGTPETPQCGFSRTSIQILGMQGVDPAKFTAFNLYIDKQFVGGCDILMQMHRDGSLADLLAEKKVIIEEEPADAEGKEKREA